MARKKQYKTFLSTMIIFIVLLLFSVGIRFIINHNKIPKTPELSESEKKAIADFENSREADSARYAAHWDSLHREWALEKEARHQWRMQHDKAYADSQRVWAAEKAERMRNRAIRQAHYDSIRASYPQKFPRGTTVDANSADTTLLQRIPGIGKAYARKIIAYREALGGFVDARQLDEIEGLPHGISVWFRVKYYSDGRDIRHININRADFKTLVHHPYLSYEQTKMIFDLRRKTGRLRSWDDLKGSRLFTEYDIQRLQPYITF